MIDERQQTTSATHNNAPIWNSNLIDWAWKPYLGELYGKDVPTYAAPARANGYENLPRTVTFVGDIESFRDETIVYVENLRKANIPVDFEIYPGCYHGFDIMNPKAYVTKKAMDFLINSFKFAVGNYFAERQKSSNTFSNFNVGLANYVGICESEFHLLVQGIGSSAKHVEHLLQEAYDQGRNFD